MQNNKATIPAVIQLFVGENWHGQLPGLGTAGYQWFHRFEGAGDVIAISIMPLAPSTCQATDGQPPAGGSHSECLDIHALSPGITILHLSQKRSWEKNTAPIHQYQIKITVRDRRSSNLQGG